jgi:multidrug resistance protein
MGVLDQTQPSLSNNELALLHTGTADVEAGRSSSQTRISSALNASLHSFGQYEVRLESNNPDNPRHWPLWYKSLTIVTISLGATVVSLFSTVYTSGIPGLEDEFGISKIAALLGVSTYLLGMAIGTIVSAPLSEVVGRRPVYLVSMALFLVLILPSALAQNIEAILIGRFFGGLFGSAIMGNSPASVNDVVTDEHRAMALGIWSIGPTNGPVYGPIIGGFVFEYLGWRWTNWIVLIIGGVVFVLMCCIKETYAPVILRKQAARLRKETENLRWWTQYDGDLQLSSLLKTSLSRPFVMLFTEPIWYAFASTVNLYHISPK